MKKKILLAIAILLVALAAYFSDSLIAKLLYVETLAKENVLAGAILLIALKAFSAPLGFPGTPLTLLSGSTFGVWVGTLVALIGNTLGALFAFMVSRYFFRDYAEKDLIKKYPLIQKYEKRLLENSFTTIMILRLIPLFPFNALNFLLGITHVNTRTYILASFIGMIPGTFMFVYFGGSLRALSPINIGLAVLGIVALVYAGKYYEKKIVRKL